MIRHLGRLVALAVVSFQASSAMAIFDAEVLVGRRWYDLKSDGSESRGVASQEVQVAFHVDPIPLVPVAFGANIAAGTLNKNDLDVDQAAIMQASAEVMAWLPMVPMITPYAKLRYPVQGTLTTKSKVTDTVTGSSVDYAATYDAVGPHVSIGAKIPALPMVKILVELGKGLDTFKSQEIKQGGVKVTTSDVKGTLHSSSLLLGVEVGI